MFFYIPTEIYSEVSCVQNHSPKLSRLGSRALIVTGKHSSRKNGSLNDVLSALEKQRIPAFLFDRIEENPSVETVVEAAGFGQEHNVDFVIGIGGGSPLDAAKAIAFLLAHPGKPAEILYQPGDGSHLPLAAVATTCGTGSEATPWAILTRHELRTKQSISHKIFPDLALCDPTYLTCAPRSVIVSTAVDALGHCIESYLNTNATVYTRMLCLQSLSLWRSGIGFLSGKEEASIETLSDLMNASTLAGMAISHTGTSLPHGLSYYLTYEENIPHGLAVGVFLAPYLKAAGPAQTAPILDALKLPDLKQLAEMLQALCPLSVSSSTRQRAISGLLANPGKLNNCPFPVSETELEAFF